MVMGILALACASPSAAKKSQAAQASAAGSGPTNPAAGDPDELVCENEMDTGSHIVEKVCRRRSQSEEERRRAQQELGPRPRSAPNPEAPGGG
jgi:hypothetical protein